MPPFRVIWEIDLDEEDPVYAAEAAREMQEDEESLATFFRVINKETGEEVIVNVGPE